jgi:hypothetical protein
VRALPTTTHGHVRGIHPDTWKALRIEAVELDMPNLGQLITYMWRAWLDSPQRAQLRLERRSAVK